jgi:DNA-binding NtrC family response regulator
VPLKVAVAEFERNYIRRVLTGTGGRKSRTAAILGLSRKALWEKLREEGSTEDDAVK